MTSADTGQETAIKAEPGVQPSVDLTPDVRDDDHGRDVYDTMSGAAGTAPPSRKRRDRSWRRAVVFGLVPALAMLVAVAAAYLKWEVLRYQEIDRAAAESLAVAKNTATTMLSYHPETVERDLSAALDRMTGEFRASYLQLTHDVVIPGARQRNISAEATVKAAASVAAQPTHAVVMLFIDQNVTIGQAPPAVSASSIRVTLDKVDDRWLVAAFDPV